MERGYVLDVTHGSRQASQWVEGAPKKSVWTGTKLSGREVYEIAAFRCPDCGALRSYATKRVR